MKNVLILGASGNIAKFVAEELNERVNLTLFLRNPAKLVNPTGKVVVGDVLDTKELTKVMKGQDVVYANLGPKPLAKMAESVTTAAQNAGVTRLIWVATIGIYREEGAAKVAQFESIYGSIDDPQSYFGDELRGANIVDQSSVISTIIRPTELNNQPEIQAMKINGRDEEVILTTPSISRKTVAHFIAELILNPDQYQNDSIALSAK